MGLWAPPIAVCDRPMRRTALLRVLVAPLVLPHELAHAAVARLGGLDPSIELLPDAGRDGDRDTPGEGDADGDHDGDGRQEDVDGVVGRGLRGALGRHDAALTAVTPLWLVRAVALAPLPTFLVLAALAGMAAPTGLVAGAVVVWCAAGASLSAGDLAVAADPAAAREAGRFSVPDPGWTHRVADVLTLVTTAVVAVLVVG